MWHAAQEPANIGRGAKSKYSGGDPLLSPLVHTRAHFVKTILSVARDEFPPLSRRIIDDLDILIVDGSQHTFVYLASELWGILTTGIGTHISHRELEELFGLSDKDAGVVLRFMDPRQKNISFGDLLRVLSGFFDDETLVKMFSSMVVSRYGRTAGLSETPCPQKECHPVTVTPTTVVVSQPPTKNTNSVHTRRKSTPAPKFGARSPSRVDSSPERDIYEETERYVPPSIRQGRADPTFVCHEGIERSRNPLVHAIVSCWQWFTRLFYNVDTCP